MASLGGKLIYDSGRHRHIQAEQLVFLPFIVSVDFLWSGMELRKYWRYVMRKGIHLNETEEQALAQN